jgi:hypothetical protein
VEITPVISTGRLKQEDCEFKASLGYTEKPSLKNKTTTKRLRSRRNWSPEK